MIIVYILLSVLMFGILIALHELGHFVAAKACGVQVNEFSIGMGPALWHKQKGETQYSFRAFPIGGFCAMEGEDSESDSPRALSRQGFWKKLVIFAAGSFMNFLTGFLIILILYSGAQQFGVPAVSSVAPEFTEQTGQTLQKGDIFWSINGERVYLYSDVTLLLSLQKQKNVDVVVERDGEKVEVRNLSWNTYTATDGTTYEGYGIYIANNITEPATLGNKLKVSWLNTIDFVRTVRLSLQMLVTGQAGLNDVSGPVGIVSAVTEVGKSSANFRIALENILYFMALIAVNLAVMNMLPIPALDGGHILFLVLDTVAIKLFKRQIPSKYEAAVNTACFVALMCFMVVVTFHDVFKLFQ